MSLYKFWYVFCSRSRNFFWKLNGRKQKKIKYEIGRARIPISMNMEFTGKKLNPKFTNLVEYGTFAYSLTRLKFLLEVQTRNFGTRYFLECRIQLWYSIYPIFSLEDFKARQSIPMY